MLLKISLKFLLDIAATFCGEGGLIWEDMCDLWEDLGKEQLPLSSIAAM